MKLRIVFLFLALAFSVPGTDATTFTFSNRCGYTVWPGILSNAGSPSLGTTGFELTPGSSRAFQAPVGWSGRFWGRTGCNFGTGAGATCTTGDCGSGTLECNGAGAAPPATLAEFTLGGGGGKDFYDVSLVDGYNLPMLVEATGNGVGGGCSSTGCAADLSSGCPAELRAGDGTACRSACEAFGKPEYCCSGEFGSPDRCKPSVWSEMFKTACPRSYSYAFDDATSTFTCTAGSYVITFCPEGGGGGGGGVGGGASVPSLKSTSPPATMVTTAGASSSPSFTGSSSSSVPDMGSYMMPYTGSSSSSTPVMAEDENQSPSWLASLATGDVYTSAAGAEPSSMFLRRPVATLLVAVATALVVVFS